MAQQERDYYQAQWPEFEPQGVRVYVRVHKQAHTHSRRKDRTPKSRPLTSTCTT